MISLNRTTTRLLWFLTVHIPRWSRLFYSIRKDMFEYAPLSTMSKMSYSLLQTHTSYFYIRAVSGNRSIRTIDAVWPKKLRCKTPPLKSSLANSGLLLLNPPTHYPPPPHPPNHPTTSSAPPQPLHHPKPSTTYSASAPSPVAGSAV